MADGDDIIIKGGSVEVTFKGSLYQQDPQDPKKHKDPKRRITRVLVKDENEKVVVDQAGDKNGLKWEIIVSTSAE